MLRGLALALLCLAAPPRAEARIGNAFGLGSRLGALAGAGSAAGEGAHSAYTNPAALSAVGGSRLHFDTSLLSMTSDFDPISGVIVSNSTTSDNPAAQTSNVDVS